jgi:hypothetical protein
VYWANLLTWIQFGVNWITTNYPMVAAVFVMAWTTIQAIIQAAINTVGPYVAMFITQIQSGFVGIQPLLDAFGGFWTALQPVLGGVLAFLGGLFLVLLGVVAGVFNGLLMAAQPFVTGLVVVITGLVTAFTGILQMVGGLVGAIIALFQGNTAQASEMFGLFVTGLLNLAGGLYASFIGLFTGLFSTLLAFAMGFVAGFIGFFQNLYMALVGGSIVPDIVNGIVFWFNSLLTSAKGIWENIKAAILGALEMVKRAFVAENWLAIGKSIIDGIANGITNSLGSMISAAVAAAQAGLKAVQDALGIHSPSEKYANVGRQSMAGWGKGILQGVSDTMTALRGAGSTLLGSASQMAGAGAGGGDNITVNVSASVAGDVDMDYMAAYVARTIKDKQRRR